MNMQKQMEEALGEVENLVNKKTVSASAVPQPQLSDTTTKPIATNDKRFICLACGSVDYPRKITRGSFFIEILLYLLLIAPGVIYTLWRLTTKYKGCRTCGSASIIPVSSPKGIELFKSKAAMCIAALALVLAASTCLAYDPGDICVKHRCDTIQCVRGKCDGWRVVWASTGGVKSHTFQCFNETGAAAFRVICRVNFLDSFGNKLGYAYQKTEGPINSYLIFSENVPAEIRTMEAEIYYATEPFDFGKTGESRDHGFIGR